MTTNHNTHEKRPSTNQRLYPAQAAEFLRRVTRLAPKAKFRFGPLCRLLAVSESELRTRFHQYLHCSPIKWLQAPRLQRAKTLLRKRDPEPLKSLCTELGFA